MTINWSSAAQTALDPEQLKEELPLEWVISVGAEIPLEPVSDDRARGLCPFHDDDDPSLDVYGHGTRWGCFPCSEGGDVLDFIGKFWRIDSFADRMARGIDLLKAYREGDDWKGVVAVESTDVQTETSTIVSEIREAQETYDRGMKYPVQQLIDSKDGLAAYIDADYLRTEWGVGVHITDRSYDVLAPYYNDEGDVISHKTRSPGGSGWYARKGRKLTALYGEWRLRDEKHVWITEGETDTWLAAFLLRGHGAAVGLPRGAGSHIEEHWIELMEGRIVTLAFDNDVAGRRAAERWHGKLAGVAEQIYITFPDSDLCETSDPRRTLLEDGEIVTLDTGFVVARGDGLCYQRVTRNGPADAVSNWVFEPKKWLRLRDLDGRHVGDGFEGHFLDDPVTHRQITAFDMESGSPMTKWSIGNGRLWQGNAKDAQGVLSLLSTRRAFLPRADATPLVGLHGVDRHQPVFIIPDEMGGIIGPDKYVSRWSFYGADATVNYADRYHFRKRGDLPWQDIVTWMLQLNEPSVVTPIIAWMAAAPLRSLVEEFPPLAVTGGSGSGKTSLLQAYLGAFFGLKTEHNLSKGTTPYAMGQWVSGTNALPVWFDEYRHGAKVDNIEAMDQMLRDAWTGSSMTRGGTDKNNVSKVQAIKLNAPIVVSGEASLTERSHIDRMAIVQMPDSNKGSMGVQQFQSLKALGLRGEVGGLYINWLIEQLDTGMLPMRADGTDRQAITNATLHWGWELFQEFCLRLGVDIRHIPLDLGVVETSRTDEAEHPILDALKTAVTEQAKYQWNDEVPVAWVAEDPAYGAVLYVRPGPFTQWALRAGFTLPDSKGATTKKWLAGRFEDVTDGRDRVWYEDPDTPEGYNRHQVRAIRIRGAIPELDLD